MECSTLPYSLTYSHLAQLWYASTLPAQFTIPKKGASEGKIKYHRRGVITKKLQFHPEYSSDPTFEGGRDYGLYCRFALVRYRPWVDAPFGRVVPDEDGKNEGEGSGTAATAEYKPEEDECIRQWREYLLELRERMHLIPDVLLPEELKGGGAGIPGRLSSIFRRAPSGNDLKTANAMKGGKEPAASDDVARFDWSARVLARFDWSAHVRRFARFTPRERDARIYDMTRVNPKPARACPFRVCVTVSHLNASPRDRARAVTRRTPTHDAVVDHNPLSVGFG